MAKQPFLKEVRTHDSAWIQTEIRARYETLRTLRFDIGFGNLNSLSKFRTAKKELAQLWTVLGEKMQQPEKIQ